MRFFLLLMAGASCLPAPPPPASMTPYLGHWKGVCADGKDFVAVLLDQADGGPLAGAVRLGNMRGGEDGQCTAVVDPPNEKHSLKVSDGKLVGAALRFKGAKLEFEMVTTGARTARLKLFGTASEDNPWELSRVR